MTLNGVLGPLGLDREGNEGGALGLWDVIAALEFARAALIEPLGGDVDAVTLFGESSGGVAVCALSASPAAAGLFSRAIIQSGPCVFDAPKGHGRAFDDGARDEAPAGLWSADDGDGGEALLALLEALRRGALLRRRRAAPVQERAHLRREVELLVRRREIGRAHV